MSENEQQSGFTTSADGFTIVRPARITFTVPPALLSFRDPTGKEVGALRIKDNQVVFEGDADQSAQLFFDAFKNLVEHHITQYQQAPPAASAPDADTPRQPLVAGDG